MAAAAKHAIAAEEASRAAKEALQSAQAKSDHLTGELESARGAELAEAEGRRVAEARIAEFETAKKAAEAEKERIRERAESRLEALKRAFEQEEQEGAAQVRSPLLTSNIAVAFVLCSLKEPGRLCAFVQQRHAQCIDKDCLFWVSYSFVRPRFFSSRFSDLLLKSTFARCVVKRSHAHTSPPKGNCDINPNPNSLPPRMLLSAF